MASRGARSSNRVTGSGGGFATSDGFGAYKADTHTAAKKVLKKNVRVAAKVASAKAPRLQTPVHAKQERWKRTPGQLAGGIYYDQVRQTKRGFTVAVHHSKKAYWGIMQELGTLAHRRKKLADPSRRKKATTRTTYKTRVVKRTNTLRGDIKGDIKVTSKTHKQGNRPKYFMRAGIRAIKNSLISDLKREMP